VACSIEWRWWVGAILQSLPPIEGALSLGAVAACAIFLEYGFTMLDLDLSIPSALHRPFSAAAKQCNQKNAE